MFLHGVFLGPLLRQLVVLVPDNGNSVSETKLLVELRALLLVRLENSGDLWDQRIVRIGITEQRADREKDLADGESGGPLGPQDVQADGAVGVNVGVVNSSCEGHFRRLEGVVGGEVDGQEENPALVGTVGRSHDRGLNVGDSNEGEDGGENIDLTCQWNRSSPTGPAEHWAGGSRPRSCNSLLILLRAMVVFGGVGLQN